MARKSEEIRNREQRERQQRLRDADRKARRPNRDDVARTALFMIVSAMAARKAEAELDELQDRVVALLVRQGFDERASAAVFDELAAKYRTGEWPFRRKVHLGEVDGADLED
jgi:hypothetical protein